MFLAIAREYLLWSHPSVSLRSWLVPHLTLPPPSCPQIGSLTTVYYTELYGSFEQLLLVHFTIQSYVMFPRKHCLIFGRVLPCLPSCLEDLSFTEIYQFWFLLFLEPRIKPILPINGRPPKPEDHPGSTPSMLWSHQNPVCRLILSLTHLLLGQPELLLLWSIEKIILLHWAVTCDVRWVIA